MPVHDADGRILNLLSKDGVEGPVTSDADGFGKGFNLNVHTEVQRPEHDVKRRSTGPTRGTGGSPV